MIELIQRIAGLQTFHDKVKAEEQLEELIHDARTILAELNIPEGMEPMMPSLDYIVIESPYYYKYAEFSDRSGEAFNVRGYTCRNDSFFFVEEREAKRMLDMIRVNNEEDMIPDPEGEWGYSESYPDLDCVEFDELELPGKTLKGYRWSSPRANGFLL